MAKGTGESPPGSPSPRPPPVDADGDSPPELSPTAAEFRRPTSRRCTAAALDLVNEPAAERTCSAETAVTRIPEAGPIAPTEPTTGAGAALRTPTDRLDARGTARCTTGPALARNGTTGPGCAANARPANGSSPAGRPRLGTARTGATGSEDPAIRALRSASSTARNPVPVNDGFCHVGRRAPNPASATPVSPVAEARWIGGSPGQAAKATAGTAGAAGAAALVELVVLVVLVVLVELVVLEELTGPAEPSSSAEPLSPSARRPRNRSKNPTAQPSAPARVTRDAISPK